MAAIQTSGEAMRQAKLARMQREKANLLWRAKLYESSMMTDKSADFIEQKIVRYAERVMAENGRSSTHRPL